MQPVNFRQSATVASLLHESTTTISSAQVTERRQFSIVDALLKVMIAAATLLMNLP